MNDEERDRLLTCIDIKLQELKKQFENHLRHHATYTYLAFATMLGLIGTLTMLIIKTL